MKQIVILLVSLVVLITSGIYEVHYLEKTSRYALSDLEYSKNAIDNDNYALAKEHIKALENTWNHMKGIWNIFVVHEEIDQIEDAMISYKVYIENEDKEMAVLEYETLVRTLSHIVEKQKLTIENVF